MAGANTEFKRLLLRGIAWDAAEEDPALTLEEALKAACRARYDETKTGSTLTAASGNGSSVTFSLPSGYSLSPESVAVACSQLYDLYEKANADLIEDGTASPTDDQIKTRMLLHLKPQTQRGVDFSQLCTA